MCVHGRHAVPPHASRAPRVSAHAADHRVFSLDVHDLKNVRRVSSVSFGERQRPHWLATDGSRIVVVNEPNLQSERRLWMLQVSRASGPHGASGPAIPHGTVFGW